MLSNTIISYQGPISFSTIDRLLSEFKIASQDQRISFKSYKRMISIMIEALENITNGEFSSLGGAGFGLIEIARTAGNRIEYEFQPLSEKYSLYIFRVCFPL